MIHTTLFHSLDHGLRAEVSKQRVIDLDVPAPRRVKVLNLGLIRQSDVRKILVCDKV